MFLSSASVRYGIVGKIFARPRSAQQASGFVRVAVSQMAAYDQLALFPVPRAQPVLVTAARYYAVHAGRPFRGHGTGERGRIVVRAAVTVLRDGFDHRRVDQIVQAVHVFGQSRRPVENQKQRHGYRLENGRGGVNNDCHGTKIQLFISIIYKLQIKKNIFIYLTKK